MHRSLWILVVAIALGTQAHAESPVSVGTWTGEARLASAQAPVRLAVTSLGDTLSAGMDLPAMGELGMPFRVLHWDSERVLLELHTHFGVDRIDGVVDDTVLRAAWTSPMMPDTARLELEWSKLESTPYRQVETRIPSGDIELAATITVPREGGPFPAVVFVHGSGPETRIATRFWVDRFARAGIASIAYDKRGAGQSTGDWTQSDFQDLADDVNSAVAALLEREEIDGDAIVLRGVSQGGWVGPLAASINSAVAGVITVAGTTVTPAEQGNWMVTERLRAQGFQDTEVHQARQLQEMMDEACRTGDWTKYREAAAPVSSMPWFEPAGLRADPDPNSWFWGFYRGILDFDVMPVWAEVTVPSLAILGGVDPVVPVAKTVQMIERMNETRSRPVQIEVFRGADHGVRELPSPPEFDWPRLAEGYLELQIEWIREIGSDD